MNFTQPDAFSPHRSFLMGNNFQLNLEIQKLQTENFYLKNMIEQQYNQREQEVSIEKKMDGFKNELLNMSFLLKKEFDKKIDEIKQDQKRGMKYLQDIWKSNMYSCIENLEKPMKSEKNTQTDIETDIYQYRPNSPIIVDHVEEDELIDVQEDPLYSEPSENRENHCDRNFSTHEKSYEYNEPEIEIQVDDDLHIRVNSEPDEVDETEKNSVQFEDEDSDTEKQENVATIKFVCEVCNKKYTSEERLKFHKRSAHKPKKCPKCQKIFAANYIRQHIKKYCQNRSLQETQVTGNMFACPICSKDFKTERSLKIHKSRQHKLRNCELCYKDFKVNSMKYHQKYTCLGRFGY